VLSISSSYTVVGGYIILLDYKNKTTIFKGVSQKFYIVREFPKNFIIREFLVINIADHIARAAFPLQRSRSGIN